MTWDNKTRNVAILIFDDVEVLDFCGPFEVFSVAGRRDNINPFNVYTVSESAKPTLARNKLSVNASYAIKNCPKPDIFVIPGGYGTRKEMHNQTIIDWIKEVSPNTEYTLSVCTGALLLAKAGLLEGLKATTHHMAIDELRTVAPNTTIKPNERFVDNGKIILSAGVAAGIDMSFYVLSKIMGVQHAKETAAYIEYPWNTE